jgi:hypothetical protein
VNVELRDSDKVCTIRNQYISSHFNFIAQILVVSMDATLPHNEPLAQQLGVQGFPTLVMMRNGQQINPYTGIRHHQLALNAHIVLFLIQCRRNILEYLLHKSDPDVMHIKSHQQLNSALEHVKSDGLFGGGVMSVALGLFVQAVETKDHSVKEVCHSVPSQQLSSLQVDDRVTIINAIRQAAGQFDQTLFLVSEDASLVASFGVEVRLVHSKVGCLCLIRLQVHSLLVFTGSDLTVSLI